MTKRLYFYLSYPLQAAALLWLLVPFLRNNNLLEWDFPGHYGAVWFLKNFLFPWYAGWNPFFYCGYPQGLFYPPLAHYLASILSFPLGIALSMKLLVLISLLLLPIAFYALARRCGLSDLQAAICASWMTAILFLSGELFETWNFGSDLKSILNIGLFANALSLPVLFGFLASCASGITAKNWKPPAILFGMLLLLHPLSSLVAVLFILSLLLINLHLSAWHKGEWKPLARAIIVASLLGALWVVPFAAYRSYMNPEFVAARLTPLLLIVLLNGGFAALKSLTTPPARPIALTYILLFNFILFGMLFKIEIQFSRLVIYLLFLIPIYVLGQIKSRFLLGVAFGLAVATGIYGYHRSGINPLGVAQFNMPDFGPLQGRVLALSPPSHMSSYHVSHELIPLKTGNASILGLFIESSLNGRFLGDLARSLDPDTHIWGTPTEGVTPQVLGRDYPDWIRERLKLFNIQYVYTDLKLEEILDPALSQLKQYCNSFPIPAMQDRAEEEKLRKRYNTHANQLDFYLYRVGQFTMIEPLVYVPAHQQTDWKKANVQWFLNSRGIPIMADQAAPSGVRAAYAGEYVKVLEASARMDRLVFQIHAEQDVPVLVKVGYFPSWRLSLNGVPAPVYRASPNLILIYGHGRAVLEYHRPWQIYAGLALSCLGFLLLLRK